MINQIVQTLNVVIIVKVVLVKIFANSVNMDSFYTTQLNKRIYA